PTRTTDIYTLSLHDALPICDIVEHFEKRIEAVDGKGMIVCMSRRICVDLYREIIKLRPEWHDDDDARGAIKVVMTGSASDPAERDRKSTRLNSSDVKISYAV